MRVGIDLKIWIYEKLVHHHQMERATVQLAPPIQSCVLGLTPSKQVPPLWTQIQCIIHIEGSWWVQVNPKKIKLKEEAVTWHVKKPHCSLSHETMGGRLMKNLIGSTCWKHKETFMAHFLLVLAWPPPRFCMSMDPPIILLYEGHDLKNLDMDPFSYVSGSGYTVQAWLIIRSALRSGSSWVQTRIPACLSL